LNEVKVINQISLA
jgi:hypothetical protein